MMEIILFKEWCCFLLPSVALALQKSNSSLHLLGYSCPRLVTG